MRLGTFAGVPEGLAALSLQGWMVLLFSATLILIPLAFAGGVLLLVRAMRRMRARAQFLVLLALGLSIGFIFLVMVQLPDFPHWLGISLMVVVFTASPFATRLFLRSVKQEEQESDEG